MHLSCKYKCVTLRERQCRISSINSTQKYKGAILVTDTQKCCTVQVALASGLNLLASCEATERDGQVVGVEMIRK